MKRSKLLFLILCIASLQLLGQNQACYQRVKIEAQELGKIQKQAIPIDRGSSHQLPNGDLILEIKISQVDLLKEKGIPFTIEVKDLQAYYANRLSQTSPHIKSSNASKDNEVPNGWDYGSMGGYLTLDEIYAHLDLMYEKYPHLISSKQAIGDFKTEEGRPIYSVCISDNPNDTEENETEVLLTAAHHAREVITPHILIYYMYYLLENYESNPEIANLIDHKKIVFVPCVNPDGYRYNQTIAPNGGGMWRKNRRLNEDNNFGVDLNRNYPFKWAYDDQGSSPEPYSDTYRGPQAGSESETQAIMHLCMNQEFRSALNFHSYSNLFLFSYAYSQEKPEDYDLLNEMAKDMTSKNHYSYGQVYEVIGYFANGDSNDWMYSTSEEKPIKTLAFTPEVGDYMDGFYPEKSRIIPLIQENIYSITRLIELSDWHVAIPEVTDKGQLKIYPQPSAQGQAILLNLDHDNYTQMGIYNMEGQLIYQQKIEHTLKVKISFPLEAGIYICSISDANGQKLAKKLVIQ